MTKVYNKFLDIAYEMRCFNRGISIYIYAAWKKTDRTI